jgi:hypothetical protein
VVTTGGRTAQVQASALGATKTLRIDVRCD